MAILDTTKRPFITDNDELINIGLDFPVHKGVTNGQGMFNTTITTLDAVSVNLQNFLMTYKGERYFQPQLGTNLRRFVFEQVNDDTAFAIEEEIIKEVGNWMPFVNIEQVKVDFGGGEGIETAGEMNRNTMNVEVKFTLSKDPSTMTSVQVHFSN